jgi:flagellar L-ring protein precursor FlgH
VKKYWLVLPGLLLLGGCTSALREVGQEPHMSPVGTGLQADVTGLAASDFPGPSRAGSQSLWDNERADLYRDPRATRVGDVVTIAISINDKATLDNTSGRSQTAAVSNEVDYNLQGWNNHSTKGTGTVDTNSSSTANGTGNIDRSEKIQVSVGAVVTQVLPNGNLVVSGSQEVRVNFEERLLKVAGIVRPRDISKDNVISYDKIAEARISYGGKGRITEVQQPSWGQQIYDIIKPF